MKHESPECSGPCDHLGVAPYRVLLRALQSSIPWNRPFRGSCKNPHDVAGMSMSWVGKDGQQVDTTVADHHRSDGARNNFFPGVGPSGTDAPKGVSSFKKNFFPAGRWTGPGGRPGSQFLMRMAVLARDWGPEAAVAKKVVSQQACQARMTGGDRPSCAPRPWPDTRRFPAHLGGGRESLAGARMDARHRKGLQSRSVRHGRCQPWRSQWHRLTGSL
jgi:hypothetical protein